MVMSYPGRTPMVPGIPMPGTMPSTMPMQYMPIGGPSHLVPVPMPMHHMISAPPMGPIPGHAMRPFHQPRPSPHQMHHNQGPGGPPPGSQGPRAPAPGGQRPNSFPNRQPRQPEPTQGPPVTVFVGNITDKAPDAMIRHILAACGLVLSWKRVQAFGFCEFAGPDPALRAIRLLHEMDIGGKKLVVKVDAKTKTDLDEFKAEKRGKKDSSSPLQDEEAEEEDYMNDEMRQMDHQAQERIKSIMMDYESDINNAAQAASKERARTARTEKDRKITRTQEKLMKLSRDGVGEDGDMSLNLDDADIEEGKRDLITREIGKFREIMKKQEEEKMELDRKRKEEMDRERDKRDEKRDSVSPVKIIRRDRERSISRSDRERDRERERERERERDRERERSVRQASRSPRSIREESVRSRSASRDPGRSQSVESSYSNKLREKQRERRRSHSRSRDRERERERDRDEVRKPEKELLRAREEEEEAKEKKKAERRAREKEAAYQERLRNWETRERRKAKEIEKEREKERLREEEREREAKKLKEFLEDYDDERDDPKYYKGRELQRRLQEREKEIEADARDRQKEKDELEELRNKIYSEEHSDPNAEFERLRKQREEQYRPKILIDVNLENAKQREKERERERERLEREMERGVEIMVERDGDRARDYDQDGDDERDRRRGDSNSIGHDGSHESDGHHYHHRHHHHHHHHHSAPHSPSPPGDDIHMEEDTQLSAVSSNGNDAQNWTSPPSQPLKEDKKDLKKKEKKKMGVKEAFNTDDDEDSSLGSAKKRKLIPLDYGDEKKKAGKEDKKDEKKDDGGKQQEEKRKHIKSLIEKIPTEKSALFAYELDWSAVDNALMERRIRPWINKKIIEYIGEPEPTLVDFICSKVLAGSPPQGILDDVQMVLDEEAEVFVVKMWRLLIYEIEAKKLGLVK